MAMAAEQEARIWQTIGVMSWATGTGMLLVLVKEDGVVQVTDSNMLSTGIAASFLMLAGIAGTVFGRAIHAVAHGYNHSEARLWHLFASVCCACGALAVLYITVGYWNKPVSLTAITIGLAGSFLIMAGIICLLGNRLMHHASRQHAAGDERTSAAGA